MAVKKIYSNYQIDNEDEIRGWQIRIAELKSLNDDYYITQRDSFNLQQKDDWNQKIKRIQDYTRIYRSTMDSTDPYPPPLWAKHSQLVIYYSQYYSIDEFTGRSITTNDSAILSQILDPKNIKVPEEPIPLRDLQPFKDIVNRKIREFEYRIETLKTKTANAMSASQNQPLRLDNGRWLYQDSVYEVTGKYSDEENVLLILDFVDKDRRKFERLKNKFSGTKSDEVKYERGRIPEEVRIAVWRRDQGRCARCGSRENLEYDHIVPVSKGGGNTERNIELLCQDCNRTKGNRIE